MKVAVLSLTRDRLEYTQRSFASLRENAGCDYTHFVLDQGSDDDTDHWLEHYDAEVIWLKENVGIHRGMNLLLAHAGEGWDAYVTFDNDCEVTMPGTLATAARVAHEGNWIVSPTVRGLINTPAPGAVVEVAGEKIGSFYALGGIFRAMPGRFARDFRFNEQQPNWGGDENDVGKAAHERGYGMGYLLDWHVTHMDTTEGQWSRYPDYFERKTAEMIA